MANTYVRINGNSFDVDVSILDLERNFNVLDGDKAGRTLAGTMERDIIGTYLGHKLTFSLAADYAELDALWDYLIEQSVKPSVMLEAADGQSTISYQAYYTSGKQKLTHVVNGINFWGDIEVNFIPISPYIVP